VSEAVTIRLAMLPEDFLKVRILVSDSGGDSAKMIEGAVELLAALLWQARNGRPIILRNEAKRRQFELCIWVNWPKKSWPATKNRPTFKARVSPKALAAIDRLVSQGWAPNREAALRQAIYHFNAVLPRIKEGFTVFTQDRIGRFIRLKIPAGLRQLGK
jgi:hypothetical protein